MADILRILYFFIACCFAFEQSQATCSSCFNPNHKSKADVEAFVFEVSKYKSLDDYLVAKTKSEKMEPNMNLVEQLTLHDYRKNHLYRAAKLFHRLSLIGNGKYCNREGFDVIGLNFKSFNKGLNVTAFEESSKNRVETLFMEYIKQHEASCRQQAFRLVKKLKKEIDEQDLKLVETVADEYFKRYLLPEVKSDGFKYNSEAEETFAAAKKNSRIKEDFPYDVLVELTQSDPKEKYLHPQISVFEDRGHANYEEVDNLFNKYLVETCSRYTKDLIFEVYGLARFWMSFHQVDSNQLEFYQDWVRTKFCVDVILEKDYLLQKTVIKILDRKA